MVMDLKNKYFLTFLLIVIFLNFAVSQIKIGDNPQNLDSSSLLELESTSKVLVINRMNSSQMQLLTPLAGALVYNTDINCLHYYDGTSWNNICQNNTMEAISIVNNGDGTYTIDNGVDPPFIINSNNESVTTLISNGDNTFTYVNEIGEETLIDLNINQETIVSTLENNGDGTFTYTDEVSNTTTIDLNPALTSSVSTLIDNRDGTYTYTDEIGTQTTFFIGNIDGRHFGDTGSVFFANETTGDPTQDNENFFWDNVNKRLGIGVRNPISTLQVNGIIRTNRINNGRGTAAFPAYHFGPAFNSGIFWPQGDGIGFSVAGRERMRITNDNRVGINVQAPQATLHVGGDLIVDGTITTPNGTYKRINNSSNAIRRLVKAKELVLDDDKTLIITPTVKQLIFKDANSENKGTIYILKNLSDEEIRINQSYLNSTGYSTTSLKPKTVTWLQSDGIVWHQIN